jgi:hypothetical protein
LSSSDAIAFTVVAGTCASTARDDATNIAQGVYISVDASASAALVAADLPKGGQWQLCYCAAYSATVRLLAPRQPTSRTLLVSSPLLARTE